MKLKQFKSSVQATRSSHISSQRLKVRGNPMQVQSLCFNALRRYSLRDFRALKALTRARMGFLGNSSGKISRYNSSHRSPRRSFLRQIRHRP